MPASAVRGGLEICLGGSFRPFFLDWHWVKISFEVMGTTPFLDASCVS